MQRTNEQLMKAFQSGETKAYSLLISRFEKNLMNYIGAFIFNSQSAEDILQETFLKLHKSKHLYKEESGRFATWIYTIARNLSLDLLRKNKRHSGTFSISNYIDEEEDFQLINSGQNPEEKTYSGILQDEIRNAMKNLPESMRDAVMLRDVDELEYEEICKILGSPMGTVKSRINRGRTRLREILKHLANS